MIYETVSAADAMTSLAVDRAVQEMIDLIRFWHRHNALDIDGCDYIIVFGKSYDDALAFMGGSTIGDQEVLAYMVIE